MHMHTMAYVWASEGNFRCQASPYISGLGLQLLAESDRLAYPGAPGDSLVPTSTLAI